MTLRTLFLVFVASTSFAQNPEVNRYIAEARKAVANKDYPTAYDALVRAHTFHPYHQGILYNLGVMAALTGKPEESIDYLHKAIHINAGYKLSGQPDLTSLAARKDFRQLLKLQKQLQKPVMHSDTAFTIKERTLHIESIALNPATGIFYVGSVREAKITAVEKNGTVKDFTQPRSNGLTSVLGLRVDQESNSLWACSSPMQEMSGYDSLAPSLVSRYDLGTGKLIRQYKPNMKTGHVFGDLVINSKGEVFVSDSKNNFIFKVNEEEGTLDAYFESAEFWNIQGLCFSDDDRYLFISDYIKGPFRLDTRSRQLIKLNLLTDVSVKGLDGLLFYKGSLIGLQNGTSPLRAMRFQLNKPMDAITRAKIIDQAHPAMNEPTQGTIVNRSLYYVATSQWGGYDDKHQLKPVSELQDVVILKCRLK